MSILTGAGGVTLEGQPADDGVLVLPPLPADPVFVEAVDEALSGLSADDLPDAQPGRPVGADPRDFASLYIRHRASFGLHARRFLNDPRDVEEVLQEAFLRLFLAMPELDCELQALSYCRRTVTNLCIDRYRADQRRPRLVDLEEMTLDPRDEASYDDPVLRAEDAAIVRQALALLSPLHRAALVKREIEEKPLAQIAAELAVPEESVKHLLYRARRALRRLLVGTTVEPGVDLSNTQLLRVANERLARATLRGANVLIVLFVAVVSVVGGLRITAQDRSEGSGEAMTPAVTPSVVGGSTDPAHPLAPRSHAPKALAHHSAAPSADEPLPPAVAPQPAASPVPAPRPAHHEASTPTHHQRRPATPPTAPKAAPSSAPYAVTGALRTTGEVRVQSLSRVISEAGGSTSTTRLTAPTSAGTFSLTQTVAQDADNAATVSLQPALATSSGSAQPLPVVLSSSSVQRSADGDLTIDATVSTAPDAASPVAVSGLQAHVVLSGDLVHVVSETVVVVASPPAAPVAMSDNSSAACSASGAATTSASVAGPSQPPVIGMSRQGSDDPGGSCSSIPVGGSSPLLPPPPVGP